MHLSTACVNRPKNIWNICHFWPSIYRFFVLNCYSLNTKRHTREKVPHTEVCGTQNFALQEEYAYQVAWISSAISLLPIAMKALMVSLRSSIVSRTNAMVSKI